MQTYVCVVDKTEGNGFMVVTLEDKNGKKKVKICIKRKR